MKHRKLKTQSTKQNFHSEYDCYVRLVKHHLVLFFLYIQSVLLSWFFAGEKNELCEITARKNGFVVLLNARISR